MWYKYVFTEIVLFYVFFNKKDLDGNYTDSKTISGFAP